MKVFMMVTQDKYELPVAVAGSSGELAKIIGAKSGDTILSAVRHAKRRNGRSKYVVVDIEEGDDDI